MLRRLSFVMMVISASMMMSAETVGLVLSGGGAKGIAHIGFIQALEENNIPIDYVTGTSMGAIVSSLYATGYSPAEMMALIKSPEFKLWSAGVTAVRDRLALVEPSESAGWVDINVAVKGKKRFDNILPTRLINPLPMSIAFMELYGPATRACGGDFDKLMVPLRTVASDIYHHRSVVFSHGELADAVRSSMSFPMVFQPIEVDGRLLYDGGLYDVYPVDVMMRDFNPDRVIGVNVSSPNTKPSLNNLLDQLDNMMTDNADYPFPTARGVDVRFHLERFSLLDWDAADEIYAIGYRRGLEVVDSIKAKVRATRSPQEVARRRLQFRSSIPELNFRGLKVENTTPAKAQYIDYLFTRATPAFPFTIDEAREGFYNVASTGRLRNLVPHSIEGDTLKLRADVDRDLRLSLGGYVTSGPGSMIYGSVGYDPFALNTPSAQLQAWVGRNYMAAKASTAVNIATAIPSRIVADAGVADTRMMETETAFYDFTTPAFMRDFAVNVTAGYEMEAGRAGIASARLGYHYGRAGYNTSLNPLPEMRGRNRVTTNAATLDASWVMNTLNSPILPVAGDRYEVGLGVNGGRVTYASFYGATDRYSGLWVQLNAQALKYFPLSRRFSVGVEGDLWLSSMPLIGDYNSALVLARQFSPFPSRDYIFDPELRANQYLAAGVHPVVSITSRLQLRADAYLYLPMRAIVMADDNATPGYGRWLSNPEFLGSLSVAFRLPFGAVTAYLDYSTSSVDHLIPGISLGLPIK